MKNEALLKQAKKLLIEGLLQCTEAQQHRFKRMYSHKNLNLSIEEAVDKMDPNKIDWAYTQIEKTLEKNSIASRETL